MTKHLQDSSNAQQLCTGFQKHRNFSREGVGGRTTQCQGNLKKSKHPGEHEPEFRYLEIPAWLLCAQRPPVMAPRITSTPAQLSPMVSLSLGTGLLLLLSSFSTSFSAPYPSLLLQHSTTIPFPKPARAHRHSLGSNQAMTKCLKLEGTLEITNEI